MIKLQIGTNAGRIWQYLDENGEKNVSEIKKALKMKNSAIWMALGWLARENKIFIIEEADIERVMLLYN